MGWDESATDVRHGGRVIISGGQITHNTASVAGGGVCAKNDSSNNTVFEIKKTFTFMTILSLQVTHPELPVHLKTEWIPLDHVKIT